MDSLVNSEPVAWLAVSEVESDEEDDEEEVLDEVEDSEDEAEDATVFFDFLDFLTAAAARRPAPMASASTCFFPTLMFVVDSFVTLVV